MIGARGLRGLVLTLLAASWGCGGGELDALRTPGPAGAPAAADAASAPVPTAPAAARSLPPPTTAAPAAATARSAAPNPAAAASAGAAQPPCPRDMVLVDGDWCTDLEVRCLERWHAPQNHLWVCERVAEPTRCRGSTEHKRYCIDRYEFPNREGVRPMVMQNFYQAQLHCARRGRRICTESEWTLACEGPARKPFPYGYRRDPRKCRGDQPWDHPSKPRLLAREQAEIERLWQGVPSGSQADCVSDYGVADLPGNADELAASETHGKGPRSDFDNVTTGGPWYLGVRNQCRPKIYSHDESFAYYYLSWRCCAEADGKPTDPRAPKQIERGMRWERVVWLAHHSWKMPFNPLVPGDAGYSPAGPKPGRSGRR